MAIDIYWQQGKQKRKVGDLSIREDLLALFKEKTGISIDEYGTTRLSINQAEVLIKCAKRLGIPIDLTVSSNIDGAYLLEGD